MAELLTNILIGVCLLLSFLGFIMTFSDNNAGNIINEYYYMSNNSNNQTNMNDTWWNIIGSKYLYNNSNILEVNETMLNQTIDDRSGNADGNYSQYVNITNLQVNSTQFNINDVLNIKMSWLFGLFYTKDEVYDKLEIDTKESVLNNSIDNKMNITNCIAPQFVRADGVCATPISSGGSGSASSSVVYYEETTNNNNNNFYSSTAGSSIVYYEETNNYISNVSDLTVNGNLNVTGNIYVGGCIMYNMSGTPVTLGDCV